MDESTALQNAEAAVASLYHLRDHYLEKHGIEKAKDKASDVDNMLKETLNTLDKLQFCIDNKALYFSLRGKALNVTTKYDTQAVDFLSKAVKLDPSLTEAWNNLGECYWKSKDIDAAKNCFTQALTKKREKVTLRNLSMVLRQLGKESTEILENVKESVKIAKEAVSLDVTDGKSWFVLGNAFLSLFFLGGQSPSVLKQSMAAYTRAENDIVEANNPDLHFNRSMAYSYQEEYKMALDGFGKAAILDPSWNDPQEEQRKLEVYLRNMKDYIEEKGKLKPKKLQNMVRALKPSDAGPYGGKEYTSPSGTVMPIDQVNLKDLKPELNAGKVVVGKLAAVVPFVNPVPYPFILVDQNYDSIAVTVFNLRAGKGFIAGDSIAIPEPYIQETNVTLKNGEAIKFRSIRVDNPVVMVVNKRKIGAEKLSLSVLSVTNKSE